MINYRNLIKCFIALFLGSVLAIVIAETIVRAFPYQFMQYSDYRDRFHYQYDKDIGYINAPNQKSCYSKDCFAIYPIYTNSLGFRDKEWTNKPGFKIALLGDSYVNATDNSKDSSPSVILGKILNQRVLNAGIGGHGTVTELIAYRKFLRPLKPDLVILFFLASNDVTDNSCALNIALKNKNFKPCAYLEEGKIKIETKFDKLDPKELPGPFLWQVKQFIKQYCSSCTVLYRLSYKKFIYERKFGPGIKEGFARYYDLYRASQDKVWEDAWQITAMTLAELKKEVEADGAKLIIVSFIDAFRSRADWTAQYKRHTGFSRLPSNFNPDYPLLRIKTISQKQGIAFLELGPYFLKYRVKFNLKPPYFSYWCDSHWSPLGHFIAAHILAKYLIDHNFLPLSQEEKLRLLQKIEGDLDLSPQEILGDKAYRQIYLHGIYTGSSNIAKILED
ncbi:hypothetical protein D4R78_00845 [bacterium]|nr:MAG: hypothetical protein D4R78_00845 [bacterium]